MGGGYPDFLKRKSEFVEKESKTRVWCSCEIRFFIKIGKVHYMESNLLVQLGVIFCDFGT